MSVDQILKIVNSLKSGEGPPRWATSHERIHSQFASFSTSPIWSGLVCMKPLCSTRHRETGLDADHGDTPWGISG